VRQGQALGDPRRDGDGPVDPRRDQAVDPLGPREPLDARLVLGGDDRAPVGVAKAGRGRLAVERDHVQLACPRRREEAELRRPGA
jgi:hypothetical protein